jgi:hypothetical protein
MILLVPLFSNCSLLMLVIQLLPFPFALSSKHLFLLCQLHIGSDPSTWTSDIKHMKFTTIQPLAYVVTNVARLVIIRIIGGISRGTYSTWNGDEKQSHFSGRKSRRRRRRMMLLVLLINMTPNCLIFEDGSTDNQRRFGNTNVHSNILPTDAQAPKLYTMWTGCCSSVDYFLYASHLSACTWRRRFERPKFRNHDNRIMDRNKPPFQAL